jgi:MazG family protein
VNDPQADRNPHPEPSAGVLDRALSLVEFLRANCPWDAAQTHVSLRRYLLEESHEVVDAIDQENDAALREELGDLLLNVAFQIVVGEGRGAFDREGVVSMLEEKMRRRHPHLYGGAYASWEQLKAQERSAAGLDAADEARPGNGAGGLLEDVVPGLDPLAHARRIQARVSEVGFDWANPTGAWEKMREEIDEVGEELRDGNAPALDEEIGDLLFATVNFARLSGVDPTASLQRANMKFSRRFRRVEELAQEAGIPMEDAGLEVLDGFWDRAKREEV